MQCAKCDADIPDGSSFCSECGNSIAGSAAETPTEPAPSTPVHQPDSDDLVYPKNPPQSPHLALISILLPGIPQLVFGQVAKGIGLLVVSILIIPLVPLLFALVVGSIVDGYMVGRRLYAGQPVRKWQFFPKE